MLSIRVHQFGGPNVLCCDDMPVPEPKANEVRLKVDVIGVNFIDICQRSGRHQNPLPLTLGQEAGGVVDAVGLNVTELEVGDRAVYAGVQGAYAEYTVVPTWKLVRLPADLDMQCAIAVMMQGMMYCPILDT